MLAAVAAASTGRLLTLSTLSGAPAPARQATPAAVGSAGAAPAPLRAALPAGAAPVVPGPALTPWRGDGLG
jgi:hypothetical protein